jgi:multiple sugar transport system ATP-binding protein
VIKAAAFALPVESRLPEGSDVIAGIRPHDVDLVRAGAEADATARVDIVEPIGSALHVHLQLDGAPDAALVAITAPDAGLVADDRVGVRFRRDRVHLFDASSERRLD